MSDTFPTADDLDERARSLERAAKGLARRAAKLRPKPRRRQARTLLGRAYDLAHGLATAEPGSAEARARVSEAWELERTAVELATGRATYMADGVLDDSVVVVRDLNLAIERMASFTPLRLRWPVQYPLGRFEVLGKEIWRFYDLTLKKDELANEFAERARRSAELLGMREPKERASWDLPDKDTWELARSKRSS